MKNIAKIAKIKKEVNINNINRKHILVFNTHSVYLILVTT